MYTYIYIYIYTYICTYNFFLNCLARSYARPYFARTLRISAEEQGEIGRMFNTLQARSNAEVRDIYQRRLVYVIIGQKTIILYLSIHISMRSMSIYPSIYLCIHDYT